MSWKRFWIFTTVCVAFMALGFFLALDGDSVNDPEFMCRFAMGRSNSEDVCEAP